MSAPKIMNSAWATPAVEMSIPTNAPRAGKNWFKKIGRITINAAPKKLPMMEPMPPIMTMNSSWNERSIENAAGSHAPKCTKPHMAPATPTMNELTPKADSLAYMGLMPITAAATSMSRMAIHSRPMWERTKFLANSAKTVNMPKQNKYLSTGESMVQLKIWRLETATEPLGVLLVNQPILRNAQSQKNCAASVATAKYKPFTRRLGMPNTMPTNVAKKPPDSMATIRGIPSIRT